MRHSFLKIAAGSPAVRVGDCAYHTKQIISLMERADDADVRVLVLPELAVTAYTCGDLFMQSALREAAMESLVRIAEKTRWYNMLVAVGVPLVKNGQLYNCAALCAGGEVLGVVPKTHLPNYGEFSERRQFTPAPAENGVIRVGQKQVPFGTKLLFCCREMPAFKAGVEICEDLWSVFPPSLSHAAAGATVLLNLSASNETAEKDAYRRSLVSTQSARTVSCYAYADAGWGESTTDLIFAGHNLICENGEILAESAKYSDGLVLSEVDLEKLAYERGRLTGFPQGDAADYLEIPFSLKIMPTQLTRHISRTPFVPENAEMRAARCEEILSMQAHALAKRLAHVHADTAVLGVSGGLDSTLALLVCTRAMDLLDWPRDRIRAVTMPCFGTTSRTKNNALALCAQIGVPVQTIDITQSVRQHFADIGLDETQRGAAYENGQARERTQVLMDIANMTGGLVVGTGDLSELALGWATYNGDHMSMYGVNASVPKTLVRHLVQYEALRIQDEALRSVLLDVLDTPVSPELLPAENGGISQKTEDIVGPYALHDFFLYYAVRWGFAPDKIFRLATCAFGNEYARHEILKWLKVFYHRFFTQQFKRSCLPDGPKIGSVSLSPRGDWRMPSDASPEVWLACLERLEAQADEREE